MLSNVTLSGPVSPVSTYPRAKKQQSRRRQPAVKTPIHLPIRSGE